ncbi:NucA/NucB deoxyribonuclease domain-containing protein [Brevibacillus sp. AG]|uniref:NucA/NucB deoxyribonuclease domain-containing protein n=1 Tax=Brevibacillus sp. AG TaxID=3020891 RepID=UPI00232C7E85|nr:NucA/NucB deoxyribonuclease domain-containing protein [Brevibacillus sp. AG]MDC0763476.1 NucA/NucB deoxyribonuclease domain-containing protein [Brevibacillus sp. AG]
MNQRKILSLITALLIVTGYFLLNLLPMETKPVVNDSIVHTIVFPSERYPETAKHIKDAVASGKSAVCTIDRDGADKNRDESLKGIPTKKGYDRDEWPMAMCAEGGTGAHIEYISPSDNRGAGSWISNQLEDFPDGTKVEIVVK